MVYTWRMLIVIKRVLYICHLVYVVCSHASWCQSGMEHLKPPEPLILSVATNKAEAWWRWKMSWELYKVASGLDKKEEKIQVATLLHVLGKERVKSFPTSSGKTKAIMRKSQQWRRNSRLIVRH